MIWVSQRAGRSTWVTAPLWLTVLGYAFFVGMAAAIAAVVIGAALVALAGLALAAVVARVVRWITATRRENGARGPG